MSKTTCFTLEQSRIHEGIAGVENDFLKGDALHVGKSSIPLLHSGYYGGFSGSRAPRCRGKLLYDAIPRVKGGKVTAFFGGNPGQVRSIMIKVATLSFQDGFQLLDWTPDLVWCGGEGIGIPSFQYEDRRSRDQLQLFAFREGQHLVVVDTEGRVMLLRLRRGAFELVRAQEDDLLDHIIGRAMHAEKFVEVRWCLKLIKALGMERRSDVVHLLEVQAQTLNRNFVLDWARL